MAEKGNENPGYLFKILQSLTMKNLSIKEKIIYGIIILITVNVSQIISSDLIEKVSKILYKQGTITLSNIIGFNIAKVIKY